MIFSFSLFWLHYTQKFYSMIIFSYTYSNFDYLPIFYYSSLTKWVSFFYYYLYITSNILNILMTSSSLWAIFVILSSFEIIYFILSVSFAFLALERLMMSTSANMYRYAYWYSPFSIAVFSKLSFHSYYIISNSLSLLITKSISNSANDPSFIAISSPSLILLV